MSSRLPVLAFAQFTEDGFGVIENLVGFGFTSVTADAPGGPYVATCDPDVCGDRPLPDPSGYTADGRVYGVLSQVGAGVAITARASNAWALESTIAPGPGNVIEITIGRFIPPQ